MLATSVAYQQMLAGQVVTGTVARINLTLPVGVTDVSATIEKLQLDKSTVTDMPVGTSFTVGYPSMALSFTLADVAQLFAPYNSGSAMWRKSALKAPVTLDIGFNPPGTTATEWLRSFTGSVDTYVCNPDGSVDFTCIDNRNLLRATVNLPAVVTTPPYNAGLTSEYAVDRLLRSATNGTISSWPAIRPQCVLAAGMRASLWPEVGTLNTTAAVPIPTFAPGALGTALAGAGAGGLQNVFYNLTGPVGNDCVVEFWASATCPGIFIGDTNNAFVVKANLFPGGVTVQSIVGGVTDSFDTTVAVPAGGGPVRVWFHQAIGSTSWNATASAGGATSSTGARTTAAARTVAFTQASTVTGTGATLEAWQVTTETALPTSTFTPQAVLNPSLNVLQVIPETVGDTWAALQQIADAEQGVCGFDEAGIFRFKNRDTIRSGASVRTVTSAASLKSLQIQVTTAAYANAVTVPFTSWSFARTPGLVYVASGLLKVPRGQTVTWQFDASQSTPPVLVAKMDSTGSVLPNSHTTTDGNTWYRASLDQYGNGQHPGPLTVTTTNNIPGKISVTVANGSSRDAWLVSPANYIDMPVGTTSLWVGGTQVTAAGEITVTQTIGTGDTPFVMQSNPWIQDSTSASALAFRLADDLSVGRPDLLNVDIVPDVSLQMTDRVVLSDPHVTGINEHVILRGSSLIIDRQGTSMSIDARAVAAPGQWILDVAGRSELGLTTWII